MDITELLAFSVKNKASDLHLSAGLPPMIRVHGDVRRINLPPMEHKDVHGMIYDIMNDTQRKVYEEHLECDFSFAVPNLARFRVNAFVQNRGAGAVFRTIPSKARIAAHRPWCCRQAPHPRADTSLRLPRAAFCRIPADAMRSGPAWAPDSGRAPDSLRARSPW